MSNAMSKQAHGQPARVTRLRLVLVKNSNIVEHVTKYMNYCNTKGKPVDRRDAEFFWEFLVRDRYSKNNPNFDRLLAQINSPANEEFWAQRTDAAANQLRKQNDAQSGFWPFPHELTKADLKVDPGLLTLGDNSKTFYLPAYNLKPLAAIDYSIFMYTLIMCNRDVSIDYPTIVELWSTLIQKVYHFEKDDIRLAKLREASFVKWKLVDAGTSTPTFSLADVGTSTATLSVAHAGTSTATIAVGPLTQELARLKGENALLKHKIGTLLGKVHSKGLKKFKSKRELTKV